MLCNESGIWSVIRSDKYTVNNPNEDWNSSSVDLMLIGDSFAHGSCVSKNQDVASVLRSLTNKGVLTLGQGGNDPLIELASLKEYAAEYKPKHVIWMYFENNDIYENPTGTKSIPLYRNYLDKGFNQDLKNKQQVIDSLLYEYLDRQKHVKKLVSTSFDFLKMSNFRAFVFATSTEEGLAVDPLFKEIMIEAKNTVSSWGGELIFLYLPAYARYENVSDNPDYLFRETVLEIIASVNLRVIDVHLEVFENHEDPRSLFPLGLSGHYNAEVYRAIAHLIVSETSPD